MPEHESPQEYWQQLDARAQAAKLAVAGENKFGMNLLRELAAAKPRENVFVSPVSVFLALAMTESGSAGSTRTAMRQVLGLPDLDAAVLHRSMDALQRALRPPVGAQFSIANSLWTRHGVPVAPAFIQQCETIFSARASSLDFSQPSAARTINDWVKTNTQGKITEIVTAAMVREAVLILTNAVYFAGKWQSEFSKAATRDELFHKAAGGTKKVPMMHHPDLKMAYRADRNYEGAVLQYKASSIVMYVLLPHAGKAPRNVLATLDAGRVQESSGDFDVDLKLPRFSLDYSAGLASTLGKMGMKIAFRYPEADFEPMGSKLFFISEVVHKTRLEVDEEGTVAAAATAVAMGAGAGMPVAKPKKTLVFDRPFVVLISDTKTGALLFAGAIEEP